MTSNQTKQTKSVKTSDSGGEKSSHESSSSDKKSDKSKLNQSSTSEVEKKTRKHKRESDELDDSRDGDSEQNLLIKNQRNSNAKSCTESYAMTGNIKTTGMAGAAISQGHHLSDESFAIDANHETYEHEILPETCDCGVSDFASQNECCKCQAAKQESAGDDDDNEVDYILNSTHPSKMFKKNDNWNATTIIQSNKYSKKLKSGRKSGRVKQMSTNFNISNIQCSVCGRSF